MPKTASKRAKARKAARVTRAHQTALTRPVVARARPIKGRARKTGFAGFVQSYPWATTLFGALIVLGFVGVLYTNHQFIWAPASPHQPSCKLSTHVCDKPHMTIDTNKLYTATIKTAKGSIVIRLDAKDAPITVNNFVYLAKQGFYNGLTFHRIEHKGQPSPLDGSISNLNLIQGGDPKGDGSGGPGYKFQDETVKGDYGAGAVAMANSGANTNGSQFFICTGDDTGQLAKSYNLFGQVISGLDVAQKITQGDKMTSVTISVETPTPTAAGGTATPTR
jgi:cyclophilin family peptidyl-prolyl cis-trans isomerase